MISKTVDLKDFAKEIGAYSKDQIEALKHATLLGIAQSIPMLVEKSPVDTGLYAQSWGFNKTETGAILGNSAPHSPIIEYGARPFKPPLAPLLAWAKRVLTNQKDEEGKVIKTGKAEDGYSDAVWALAIYTQNKIDREGMKPKLVMQNAIPEILENIKEEYLKIGKR
jgi:hypothetical protein